MKIKARHQTAPPTTITDTWSFQITARTGEMFEVIEQTNGGILVSVLGSLSGHMRIYPHGSRSVVLVDEGGSKK